MGSGLSDGQVVSVEVVGDQVTQGVGEIVVAVDDRGTGEKGFDPRPDVTGAAHDSSSCSPMSRWRNVVPNGALSRLT